MTSGDLKVQRAVLWSRRFSLLYAMGVWTMIGYFVSRSVRFREIPLEEKEEKCEQQPPPPPPPGISRAPSQRIFQKCLTGAEDQD